MPATFQIAGPTTVQVDTTGTYVQLGFSDNDNLPSIQFTDHHHEVKTVLSGNVPAEIVLTGTSARISLALVKWNQSVLVDLLEKQRGTANSTDVGAVLVGGATARTFGVKIFSVGGTSVYVFDRCYLQPDGVSDSQWGNRERVLTLNLAVIPNSVGELYTYTA